MSFRRFLSLVLVLVLAPVVSACASSSDAPFSEDAERATRATGGNSTLIVRAQLEFLSNRTAWDAVETLNRRWIRASRGGSIAGPAYARVAVDGIVRGELDVLRQLSTTNIETMRYLSATDATTKYGIGFPGEVIEMDTKRGR